MASSSAQKLNWLVTGANSGFGLQLCLLAARHGDMVIGTVRPSAKIPRELEEAGVHLVKTEMTAPATEIRNKVDQLVHDFGHIDVLVNNAAFAQLGHFEEVTNEQARYQFDVNLFGPLNLMRAVLPHMRQRRSGTIVNLSSIAGIRGNPSSSLYSATKFALEGISEALLQEMKPFNVRVHVVEPGYFRTAFLERQSQGTFIAEHVDAYEKTEVAMMHGRQYGDPVKGAERIFEVVTETGLGVGLASELRILLGHDAIPAMENKIKSLQQSLEKTSHIALSTDL
jgi:NAD(P)-dependent dehydrogenase (short-subunit alcohol dehydrogenase family)